MDNTPNENTIAPAYNNLFVKSLYKFIIDFTNEEPGKYISLVNSIIILCIIDTFILDNNVFDTNAYAHTYAVYMMGIVFNVILEFIMYCIYKSIYYTFGI